MSTVARVNKLNIVTMTTIGVYQSVDTQWPIRDIVSDGVYLYCAFGLGCTYPTKIVKVDNATMTSIASLDITFGITSMIFDGTYLYISYSDGINIWIDKINPITMMVVVHSQVIYPALQPLTFPILTNGPANTIYILAMRPPRAEVITVDTTTMTYLNHWSELEVLGLPVYHCINYINGFIYVGLSHVYKIDITTMTTVDQWNYPILNQWTCSIYNDGVSIYIGIGDPFGWGAGLLKPIVYQVNPAVMVTTGSWIPVPFAGYDATDMTINGLYIC
jgi:hypothetical protein